VLVLASADRDEARAHEMEAALTDGRRKMLGEEAPKHE
jgi:hypothetical protein